MLSKFQSVLIGIEVYKILVLIFFVVLYGKRIYKLDRLASNSVLKKNSVLKLKIVLLSILIFLLILHIILAFADQSYWLYQFSAISLIESFYIVNLILQIYIFRKEYKKNSTSERSMIALWLFMTLGNIATIINVIHFLKQTLIVIEFLMMILQIALVVTTVVCWKESQISKNIEELRQSFRQNTLLPLINEYTRTFEEKNKIYIEFNRQFELKMIGAIPECIFKIAVYVSNESHIVTKSEEDFISLSKVLMKKFPSEDAVFLKSRSITASNVMKYGEEKQKIYENYLLEITKNSQFYIEDLLLFLQVPLSKQATLQNRNNIIKKDTINSDDEQRLKQGFFQVFRKQGKIYASNVQILQLILNKKDEEIIEFHHRLYEQKKIKTLFLPSNPDDSQILHFLDHVINSKNLWRSFAEWMCLGAKIQDKIYNMLGFWKHGFKNIQISIIGHQVQFDKQGNIVSYYLVSVRKKNSQTEALTIKKRFNDFIKLDKQVHKFVETVHLKNAHLPTLPPKFSPFGNKTSPKARQIYLDSFLKELIKIQGINHCVKLIEFLEVDNSSFTEEFYQYIENQTQTNSYRMSKVEEIQLEKIR